MIRIVILLLVPSMVMADDQWWRIAFPGSIESKSIIKATSYPDSTSSDRPYYDNEHPAIEESDEPQVYHWDNIYLERAGPEVIINPYINEREKIYWDEDEL
jgi:hypothetical protein